MKDITFSSDEGELSMEDHIGGAMLMEEYFKTESHPEEFQINMEAIRWNHDHLLDCINVIKYKGKVIGEIYVMPCTKEIMERFLADDINEKQMSEEIREKVNYRNFDCIYLCSSFIKPEFRGKGLSVEARIKTIKKVVGKRNIKPILFYEPYTKEGEMSCKKVAKILGLKLLKKN